MHEKIQNQIKDAMRAKDAVRLTTLRGALTAFTNEAVARGGTPQTKLKDEEVVAVIKRLVKQRKDSIEQFEKGGRQDLADNEKAELVILEEFLPAQMNEEEIKKIIEKVKSEIGEMGKEKSGIIVGKVMKESKGMADGNTVKRLVEEYL